MRRYLYINLLYSNLHSADNKTTAAAAAAVGSPTLRIPSGGRAGKSCLASIAIFVDYLVIGGGKIGFKRAHRIATKPNQTDFLFALESSAEQATAVAGAAHLVQVSPLHWAPLFGQFVRLCACDKAALKLRVS